MIVRASAPGEIFLFGEHAVLFGQPGLAAAISRRTTVEGRSTGKNTIELISDNIGWLKGTLENNVFVPSSCLKYDSLNKDAFKTEHEKELGINIEGVKESFSYVIACIEMIASKYTISGLKIHIKSTIPPGSGLASSSAVTVATLGMLNKLFNCNLDTERIVDLAYEVELTVQKIASKTGVAVSGFGGLVQLLPSEDGVSISVNHDFPNIPVVIGHTGIHGSTKELVAGVKQRHDEHPKMYMPVFDQIGNIVRRGKEEILAGNLESIGTLMNINQGMLEAIGVNSKELSDLIFASRAAGAYGAKLTGAGGGGCMYAVCEESIREEVMKAMEPLGTPLEATLDRRGLVVEVESTKSDN